MQTPFAINIQRIVPGGRGIAFHDGQAVFAPLTVPGDTVEVTRYRDRKGYLEVLDSRLLHPSPERVSPPCPYFGSCGGCDFQQMSYSQQLAAKQGLLLDALRRIGKIQVDTSRIRLHASPQVGYRNRLQLKLVQSGDCLSWGFYKVSSHEVCAVDACLIASGRLWERLEVLRQVLESMPQVAGRLEELEAFLGDDQECLITMSLRDMPPGLRDAAGPIQSAISSLEEQGFRVSLCDSAGRSHAVAGKGFVSKTAGGFRYRVSHGSFFQVNDSMLATLQNAATQGYAGKKALELFSGVGFFSLPLAKSFEQLELTEGNPAAIADLRENLRENGIENCQLYLGNLANLLKARPLPFGEADLLLIDPPRTGLLKETVQEVAGLAARDFVYVSCDPSMLARDLRILVSCHYEIVSLDLLDLFPQTHHLETVARLRRS
ncbi:MAG: class I SAM-dependent RNA methyltransferase [Acidobacteria bacterium]|nr:class I SAM-dependent RNA methyltransferase [Acidobacteriota bacterium]MCI0718830.1 class I SAM-dependent RNA methyltransferase [Acidobacteriota bacterium]